MSLGCDSEVTFPPEAVALSISLHSKIYPPLYLDTNFLLLLTANPLQTNTFHNYAIIHSCELFDYILSFGSWIY